MYFVYDMAQARHYRGLNTNLDNLYNTIKQVLEDEKNLIISQEFNGTLNEQPIRRISARNKSAKVIVGSLAEIHVSITGNPADYVVEVASNAWLESFVMPGLLGLIVGGPIGLGGGLVVGGVMAHEFEKHLWEKISKAVDSESAVKPSLDSVTHYHS
jgi:hypothetical protein